MGDDAVERHRSQAAEVVASGDPAAIKALYVDLGDDLWARHGDAPETAPLFSLAGTHPVVAAEFDGGNGTVLDAGCGPYPALSIALARGDRTVVALDIGLGTVRSALGVAAARDVTLLGVVGDVEALPFRTGAFAGVACDDTIEHLPDDRAGADELVRVCAPDALLVVATPNRHSLGVLRRKLGDRLRGRRHPDRHYFVSDSHLREYTWRELETLVGPLATTVAHRGVPFDARRSHAGVAAAVNWLVTKPVLRRWSPMIVLALRPRAPRR